MARLYEDFHVGDTYRSALGRTVTETDNLLFTMLTMNTNELHFNEEAAARTAQLSPEALQWRTFEVVGELFARLAESSPLVLALEDLHWADQTSVLLLEQLLSLAEEAPVLVASWAGARLRPSAESSCASGSSASNGTAEAGS